MGYYTLILFIVICAVYVVGYLCGYLCGCCTKKGTQFITINIKKRLDATKRSFPQYTDEDIVEALSEIEEEENKDVVDVYRNGR